MPNFIRTLRVAYWGPAVPVVGAAWALWRWVPEAITKIGSESYLPHGFCYLWNPRLLTLHVLSDSMIFLSYVSISATLAWLLYRERKRVPFAWIFLAFGLFIVSCGFTHALDVLVLWVPLYWLQGDVKLLTAIASATTAVALPIVYPKVRRVLDHAYSSRQNELRFLAASDSGKAAFYIFESVRDEAGEIVDFRFSFTNRNGARMVSSTAAELEGKLLCEQIPLNRMVGFVEEYKRVVETGEPVEREFAIREDGINAEWLYHQVVKLGDGVAITASDISDRKRGELKLESMAKFKQSIFTSSPIPTIVTDLEGVITSLNPAAEGMLGYTKDGMAGRLTPLVVMDAKAVAERAARLSEELGVRVAAGVDVLLTKPRLGLVDEGEWNLIRRDGSRLEAHVTISALTGELGEMAGLILIAHDITERKRAEEYISHLAHHDALTGLPTRTLLHDRLAVSIKHAERRRKKVALLMVDVDHFKKVNDMLGHHMGDELLVEFARRLTAMVRESDTVARMGGDEFVVLLDEISGLQEAEAVAEKLLDSLQVPFRIGDQTQQVTASIGICMYPDNGASGEALLQNADAAMYRVKSEGRNGYQNFTVDMASASSRKRELESGLRNALRLEELELVWQPQISLTTGCITGIEALLRWKSSRLGMVMPNEFIPVAEESGMIVPIGEWVLRTACREGQRLQQMMGRRLIVAVNVSPRQFHQETLSRVIEETLEECGMDADLLELEITENILVNDSPRPMAILEKVRALGVRLAIDDFGTGFSSMSYILRFRVDRLKIDQSFVRNMTVDLDSRAVTTAVTALASGLRINVVAEGVETPAHRDLLHGMGCDEAQGYLYSRPVSIENMPEVIRELELAGFGTD